MYYSIRFVQYTQGQNYQNVQSEIQNTRLSHRYYAVSDIHKNSFTIQI